MQTGAKGLALIKSFEGCILQPYDDYNDRVIVHQQLVRGTPTIGWGHTSAAGPPLVTIGLIITQDQADQILAADLKPVEQQVTNLIKVPLNQNQFDALVSFQFNTGWLGHPQCSLTRALNAGNYALAAADFSLYDEAGGKVLTGLVRRRAAEAALFNTPVGDEYASA